MFFIDLYFGLPALNRQTSFCYGAIRNTGNNPMVLLLLVPSDLLFQLNVSGVVSDAETGRPLAGANVIVNDTDLGVAADSDGNFTIEGVEAGASITASMIGYEDVEMYADSEEVSFQLTRIAIEMSELEVLASRAGENTPVAYTNVSKEDLNIGVS